MLFAMVRENIKCIIYFDFMIIPQIKINYQSSSIVKQKYKQNQILLPATPLLLLLR